MDNLSQKIRRSLLIYSLRKELRRRGASTRLLDAATRLVAAADGPRDLGILTNWARDMARGNKSLKREEQQREKYQQNARTRGEEQTARRKPIWNGWQKQADAIWRVHPEYSKSDVAKVIAERTGGAVNTIRQRIRKKS